MLRTLVLWKPPPRAAAASDLLPCLLHLPAARRDASRRDATNVGQRAPNDGRVRLSNLGEGQSPSFGRVVRLADLSRLDPRAVRLDGPLPRGPSQAPIPIRRDSRIRRDQSLVLDAREHVRHQDVGDGETLCRDEVACQAPVARRFKAR